MLHMLAIEILIFVTLIALALTSTQVYTNTNKTQRGKNRLREIKSTKVGKFCII